MHVITMLTKSKNSSDLKTLQQIDFSFLEIYKPNENN